MRVTLHPVTLSIALNLRMSGGPRFSTTYLEDGAGNPQTVIGWDDPLWEWNLMFKRGSRDWGLAMGFFLARKGMGYGWYFDDPFDCTHSDHNGQGLVRTQEDGKRYLVKRYPDVDSYAPYERIIKCPVPGTVSLSGVSGSPIINYATGEVTGATSDGTATFQFRNPVIFATDMMALQRAPANAPGEWSNVTIRELRRFEVAS